MLQGLLDGVPHCVVWVEVYLVSSAWCVWHCCAACASAIGSCDVRVMAGKLDVVVGILLRRETSPSTCHTGSLSLAV